MEHVDLIDWYFNTVHTGIVDFMKPLCPWLLFCFVMVFADWRFTYELWLADKSRTKPKAKYYWDKITNSILLVLLAGCLRVSSILDVGVEVVSTTGLVIWSAVEFSRVFNKYMEIEGMGIKINIFKFLRKTKADDIIEDVEKKDETKEGNEKP
jgi:hypothetical protein